MTVLVGDGTVEAKRASLSSGRSGAFRLQTGIAGGAAGSAEVFVDSHTTSRTLFVGLYSNSGSHPGSLLSIGSLTSPHLNAWNDVTLSTASLAPETTYWLALLGTGGALDYRYRAHSYCAGQIDAQGNLGSLPTTWSAGIAHSGCPVAAYITEALPPVEPVLPISPIEPVSPVGPIIPIEQPKLPVGPKAPVEAKLPVEVEPPVEIPVEPKLPVLPPAPSNTALPAISGTTTEGQTLTATHGTWSGNPTSYTYQWQDCNTSGTGCTNLNGADSTTYALTDTDAGHTIRVEVTATNTGGSANATSNATATIAELPPPPPPAPSNTTLPAVSGTATEDQTLTATHGTWTGSPTGYEYQWQDCGTSGNSCSDISNADNATYALTAADAGHTIRVQVTATNAGGSSTATSNATAPVAELPPPPPAAPSNTVLPAISGTTTEGQALTATHGTWTGSPTGYEYQWQDCNSSGASCTNINGATAATDTLTSSDAEHTIRVQVTATNAGGSSSATSNASATVAELPPPPPAAPTNTTMPAVSGTTTEGHTLATTSGSWTGNPTGYTYQWRDCNSAGKSCSNVSGAGGSTYTLTSGDVGHTVRVMVTATNAGGSDSMSSPATASVSAPPPAAPSNTTLPAISGSTTEGQTLSASTGGWTSSPTSYAYQWQDCNTTGNSCTTIKGAIGSTDTLTSADAGHTIRVQVTATNAGGSSSATSNQTATVAAEETTSTPPTEPGCTTTISSGLQSAISSAAAGSTICLNAGSYGSITVNTKKASMVKVAAASGVSAAQATLGYVQVESSSNITFEGLTIAGANNGSSSTPATHIHWISDAFTSGVCVQAPTSANIDILVEHSTFINVSSGGCGNEGRLEVNGDNEGPSGTNGVVISHDVFKTASPSGCTDGVNITGGASGTQIGPGNEFANMKEGSCSAHVDPIQFYGAKGTTVTDNYFHGNSDGIMSPDGNGSPMTVTNNVFDTDGEYPDQIVIGGGEHDVISHNTFGHGGDIRIGHVNVGATASNETITNNILTGGLNLTEGQSSSGWTITNNLVPSENLGTQSVKGTPSYVGGGSEPSTWAGWALTAGSPGNLAASDGTNIGTTYFGPVNGGS